MRKVLYFDPIPPLSRSLDLQHLLYQHIDDQRGRPTTKVAYRIDHFNDACRMPGGYSKAVVGRGRRIVEGA